MIKTNLLEKLLRSSKTVFSFKEISLLASEIERQNLKAQLHYYVTKKSLYHLRRGIYAKDKNYNRLEVATKIITPAYISFETVLRNAGIIFQYYEAIYVASTHSRTVVCDGQEYVFRKIKESILTNPTGVEILNAYSIATPERAFLDLLYLYGNYYLDNPNQLNWERVLEIVQLYENKKMVKTVGKLYKEVKQGGKHGA